MDDLIDAVIDNEWVDIVDCLFSDQEGEYYDACVNENLEKARGLMAQGHFADQTYLWNLYDCDCWLEGCHTKTEFPPISYIVVGNIYLDVLPNKELQNKLIDYGLLPDEEISLYYSDPNNFLKQIDIP